MIIIIIIIIRIIIITNNNNNNNNNNNYKPTFIQTASLLKEKGVGGSSPFRPRRLL